MKYGPSSYFELGAVYPRNQLRQTIRRKRLKYKQLPIGQLIDPRVDSPFIYVLDAYGKTVEIQSDGVLYVVDGNENTVDIAINDTVITLSTRVFSTIIASYNVSVAISPNNTFYLGN